MLHTGYWKEWNCVEELKMYSTALIRMKLWIPSTLEHILSFIKWKGLILDPHKKIKLFFCTLPTQVSEIIIFIIPTDRPTFFRCSARRTTNLISFALSKNTLFVLESWEGELSNGACLQRVLQYPSFFCFFT